MTGSGIVTSSWRKPMPMMTKWTESSLAEIYKEGSQVEGWKILPEAALETVDLALESMAVELESVDLALESGDVALESVDAAIESVDFELESVDLALESIDLASESADVELKSVDLAWEGVDAALEREIAVVVDTSYLIYAAWKWPWLLV